MKISRFYCPIPLSTNQSIELPPEVHRHAIQVLRLTIGEPLILFNGQGGEYLARLAQVEKRRSQVSIEQFIDADRESPLNITLVQSLIKPDKFDIAIQKSVELGVTHIQPVISERSVAKIKNDKVDKKLQHWQGIIIAACEQSGRTMIPEIAEPVRLNHWLDQASTALRLMMLPTASQSLKTLSIDPPTNIELLIGPEGGFTDQEEQHCLERHVQTVTFGPRILRAETAAAAGISLLQHRWGDV